MKQLHKAIRFIFTAENLLVEKINQSDAQKFESVVKEINQHTDTLATGLKFSYSYMSEQATEFIPANQLMDQKAFVIKGYTNAIQKRGMSTDNLLEDLDNMISMYALAHEIAVEKNEVGIAKFIANRLDTYRKHHAVIEQVKISQESLS